MQDPNLDPKLSGLNEPAKLNLPGILPPNVDPRLGQLDVRNFSPKELLQLLKQIPLLQVGFPPFIKRYRSVNNVISGECCCCEEEI